MHIPIDRQCSKPLYRQIGDYFREVILSGSLPSDTRLPATRKLARDLGVNRLTVETAYTELETEGLVYSREGSGTYVQPSFPLPPLPISDPSQPWPLWQKDDREIFDPLMRTTPRELLKQLKCPNPIDFSTGYGDSRLFLLDEFRKTLQKVLKQDGVIALEYGEKEGYAPLRSTIAHVLASQGLKVSADSILITSGSQQALSLVVQSLVKHGDTVLTEDPTYSVAISLFRYLGIKMVGIPVDDQGMQVERVEKALQLNHPKLILTIPDFHNPTGSCMSLERRRQLIILADRYNVPILEDDYVGDLRFEGRALPALKELDPGGRVIYISTFSKMLVPGLRLGFLIADGPIYNRLVGLKYGTDLSTSGLVQRVVEESVTVGRYHAHLHHTCQVYRKRRDAMLKAIQRYFPPGVRVTPPQGGLFLWMGLPEGMCAGEMLPLACEEGVAYIPGGWFYLDDGKENPFMRLNFSFNTPEVIEEGVRRLGVAFNRYNKSIQTRRSEYSG